MENKNINDIFKNADPKKLAASLSQEDQQLLNTLLEDKSAREKFLSSKEAQQILKMLGKR